MMPNSPGPVAVGSRSQSAGTSQTNASFTGLTCGSAYPVGVDAYDAAGNRSSLANMTVSTTACADTNAPTAPSNLIVGTRTASTIALSWAPSTDNAGVVGYGLYYNERYRNLRDVAVLAPHVYS